MPDNTRYRDPNTGRWVTRESAGFLESVLREVFQGRQRQEQTLIQSGEEVSEFGGETAPEVSGDAGGNWDVVDYTGAGGGLMWVAEEPEGDEPAVMDYDALSQSSPPWGVTSYQVRYAMPADPNYPRGFASSYTLMVRDVWPPPENDTRGEPLGIAAVIFRV